MSIFNKQWNIESAAQSDGTEELHPIVARVLTNRGLKKEGEIEKFLNPDYETTLNSPYKLQDIKKAAERVLEAIKNKEQITIYGDYDADGVCASTLLKEGLEKLGAKGVKVFIPHREKEGYGMNMQATKNLVDEGAQLIITVDCGSSNHEEVAYAQNNGVDVVVTDHHQVLGDNHPALAFINPHRPGSKYPFADICGTTVAFKLVQVLIDLHKQKDGEWKDGEEKWLLDLVGLATVTDVMPLLDENRTFVKYGLYVLAHKRRPGFAALMDAANVKPEYNDNNLSTNLNAFHLGFVLGPRINAAGRMEHARLAFDLLNAPDIETARMLAQKLDIHNSDRKDVVAEIISELDKQVLEGEAIVAGSENWPIGVLGIVAGRLAEQHNKPAFIYQKQDGRYVGSARTPAHINTVKTLESASGYLQKFGGHAQAGGFTIIPEHENAFQNALQKYVAQQVEQLEEEPKPALNIDAELSPEDITLSLAQQLEKLEPHGEGNPKPLFVVRDAALENIKMVGAQRNHFKCDIVSKDNKRAKAIGFRFGGKVTKIKDGDKADIVFNLEIDEWNGRREVNLKLVDLAISNKQ